MLTDIKNLNFTTKRLDIQEWHKTQTDLVTTVQSILTPEVTHFLPSSWQGDYTEEQTQEWIEARDNESIVFLVSHSIKADAIGLIILAPMDESTYHIGYILVQSAWNHGYATELLKGFITWVSQKKIKTLVAGVDTNNDASIRVLEKNGFTLHTQTKASSQALYRYNIQPI